MYFYYFMRWCLSICFFFFFNDTATTEIYTLSLHDALPIWLCSLRRRSATVGWLWLLLLGFIFERDGWVSASDRETEHRSEEHTSELQSRLHLVCRLLLEKKKNRRTVIHHTRAMRAHDRALS